MNVGEQEIWVYSHFYWLVIFCTTNSSPVLAMERLQNSRGGGNNFSWSPCTFTYVMLPSTDVGEKRLILVAPWQSHLSFWSCCLCRCCNEMSPAAGEVRRTHDWFMLYKETCISHVGCWADISYVKYLDNSKPTHLRTSFKSRRRQVGPKWRTQGGPCLGNREW